MMRKFTTTLFDRVISAMAKVAVVVALLAAVPAMNSCSKDNTEETKVSGKGWTIASTISTDDDGAAELSCSGAKQSVSVTFSVEGEYEIDTDGSEWFTVAMNGTGTAGKERVVKFNVAGNTADVMRTATAYITVKGKERVKFATLSQSVVTISDPVVKWIDERLSKEYYWLDEYNEKADAGEINYELAYNEFLSKALLSMKTNMDDGYIDYDQLRDLAKKHQPKMILAGDVHGRAVGQMAAMSQIHTQHGISHLTQGLIDGIVGAGAGMGLHVGMVGAKQLAGALAGDFLHHIHALTAAVIPLAGVTLGILIGQNSTHRGQYSGTDKVLRCDQLDIAALTVIFRLDRCTNLGVE